VRAVIGLNRSCVTFGSLWLKVNEVHQNQVAIEVELKEEISELHAEVERLSTAAAEAGREVECRLEKRMQQAQAHSRKLASDFEILNQQVAGVLSFSRLM